MGISFNKNLYAGNSLFADIDEKIQVFEDGDVSKKVDEEIVAYYSHTGGVYGKFGHSQDFSTYEYSFPNGFSYEDYKTKFKTASIKLISQLNYVSMLYSDGVYQLVYDETFKI